MATPSAANHLETHPAMTRRCPLCGADPGTPCIDMIDGSESPLLHLTRCASPDEIAMLRDFIEQGSVFPLVATVGEIEARR